ncbi:MAG: hypothetical protein E6Q50_03385 [Lysobacter sp.]|nr:MAG: hypothetical protein E6Q50_03385 [Lysobacter sp.]
MNITPTPITAALAGVFAAIVMPILWSKSGNDSLAAMAAFLLVVALPAHAFVVGFRRNQAPSDAKSLDVALLKRIGIWLFSATVTAVVVQFIRT